MAHPGVRLSDLAAVLGVDKSTASRLRAGAYDRPTSDLPSRYAALMALIERVATEHLDLRSVPERALAAELCRRCPRESCDGCRALEV